ncbi:MAG TPA: hypothetical protein VFE51_16155 [Verrucomicrobiae bacterium]|nr:hypothetical protein [Verrucomicrobiae bacterium]
MKSLTMLRLVAISSFLCAIEAGAQLTSPIAAEFLGRDQFFTGDPACQGLSPGDVAGVVPQGNWFQVDNYYNANFNCDPTTFTADHGTTMAISDTNSAPTGVTLTFSADDSWDNNVNLADISTPNAFLMQGTIKQANGSHTPLTLTFNNVPPGQYDVYVYCDVDGNGVVAKLWDFYNITTNYILEQQQFYDTNTFIQSTATTAAQATNVANYVKFTLSTDVRGQLGILAQWVSSTLGLGVTGIQLVPKGAVVANTIPLSFMTEPASRRGALGASNITFSATVRGPMQYLQWLKNGVAIPGETNTSYTPSPILSTDNGATIAFTASNNLNSITSSNAVLTVGQYVTNNGIGVLDGGIINITSQPQNLTVVANRGARPVFSVAATTDGFTGDTSGAQPPLTYQWMTAPKGSSTFTIISNQTRAKYTAPLGSPADDGRQFKVNVTYPTLFSSTAVLTVLPNTNPPVLIAGAITRNDGVVEVAASFDEQVDPTTLIPANFSLNAGTITGFKVATNSALSYQSAILETTGLTPGSNYVLTGKNVIDLSGNVLKSTNVSFTVPLAMQWAEIGSPPAPGQVIPVGKDGFDILNGGRGEWANYDEVDMAYVKKTNDFDVKVQVIFVEPASEWTRCGLQARNALNVGEPSTDHTNTTTSTASAYAQTHVNGNQDLLDTGTWPDPTQIANGASNNGHEQNTRPAKGAATGSWGSGLAGAPNFPDVWLRLARQGANLHGYSSVDGVTWVDQGTTTLTDQQPDMYVGMSLSVETANIWSGSAFDVWNSPFDPTFDRLFVGQFRNFGDYVASAPAPTLTISQVGGALTITYTGSSLQQSATLGAGANWAPVTGASSPYTVPKNTSAMFFRAMQ